MCYIVYKTTNLVNGKIYVGQHHTSADDGYFGSGKLLKRSIKKEGIDNFKRDILEYCTSANVNEMEIFWIAELNATNKDVGYNITKGGQRQINTKSHNENISNGKLGYKMTDEHKQNASKTFFKKGQIPWNLNKSMSEDTKQKLRDINLGRKMSKESVEKMSKSHKGKRPYIQNDETKRNIAIGGTEYIYTLTSPSGVIYDGVFLLKEFCVKHNLNNTSIWAYFNYHKMDVVKYKNWKIERSLK